MSAAVPTAVSVALVGFSLDGRRYAVDLARVERVLRMVALTPFPQAPAIVAGVFDFHGRLVPVMNVRRRFGLRERPAAPSDQLLVLRTGRRMLAFAVDAAEPAMSVPAEALTAADAVVPGLEQVRGIVRLPESGILFVHDIDTFLSLDEAKQLDDAMDGRRT